MEGYLYRWTNIISRWKWQYFILHEDVLVYCDKKEGKKLGCIYLKIAQINNVSNDPLKIIIHSGTSEILLKASNASNKNLWVSHLNEAKNNKFAQHFPLDYYENLTNQNKSIPSEAKAILLNSNLSRLDTLLAQVWHSQAKLDETLSYLTPLLNKNDNLLKLADDLEKYAQQLKSNVTKCSYLIEDEWKNLNRGFYILTEQNQQQTLKNENSAPHSLINSNKQFFQNDNIFKLENQPFKATDITNNQNFQESRYMPINSYNSMINNVPQQQQQQRMFQSYQGANQFNDAVQFQQQEDNDTIFESFIGEDIAYHHETQRSMNLDRQSSKRLGNGNGMSLSQSMAIQDGRKMHPFIIRLCQNNPVYKQMYQISAEPTRQQLPAAINPDETFSFWSILKNSIGKDLSKISFPVQLNEPLSMLQKMVEQFEHSRLLDMADQQEDSGLRMAYVMGFSTAYFSTQINRTKKPFNPLLHETYELISKDFKFVAEQVSHHPPISACFCYNDHFEYNGTSQSKTQFLGHKMEIKPISQKYIKLKKHNDQIEYKQCVTTIHNIIMGTMYADHHGEMKFANKTTGDTGSLIFSEKGWNGRGQYEVNGYIKNAQGQEIYKLKGRWDQNLVATHKESKNNITIWEYDSTSQFQYKQYYLFSQFSMNLNHLSQKLMEKLPPTDTRFRPDQRALECGNTDMASEEKLRLEQKQRKTRKENEIKKFVPKPFWFKENLDNHGTSNGGFNNGNLVQANKATDHGDDEKKYTFAGEYFQRKYQNCPDIY